MRKDEGKRPEARVGKHPRKTMRPRYPAHSALSVVYSAIQGSRSEAENEEAQSSGKSRSVYSMAAPTPESRHASGGTGLNIFSLRLLLGTALRHDSRIVSRASKSPNLRDGLFFASFYPTRPSFYFLFFVYLPSLVSHVKLDWKLHQGNSKKLQAELLSIHFLLFYFILIFGTFLLRMLLV